MDRVDWNALSSNPCIFELDYSIINQRQDIFLEELMAKVFHPYRVKYYINEYKLNEYN